MTNKTWNRFREGGVDTGGPVTYRINTCGFAFEDQKRSVPTDTCNRGVEERKDRPIGIGEPWSADLTLKNQDLVAEGEDLSVT